MKQMCRYQEMNENETRFLERELGQLLEKTLKMEKELEGVIKYRK
jgi:hypothetical protein